MITSKELERLSLGKWDAVELYWEDSHSVSGWSPLDQALDGGDECIDHRTVGLYAGHTERRIMVVQSVKASGQLNARDDTYVDVVMSIPLCAVTKLVKLTEIEQ